MEKVSKLIEELKNESPEVRYRAVDELAKNGGYEAVVALIDAATGAFPTGVYDRLRALEALTNTNSETAREFLRDFLEPGVVVRKRKGIISSVTSHRAGLEEIVSVPLIMYAQPSSSYKGSSD